MLHAVPDGHGGGRLFLLHALLRLREVTAKTQNLEQLLHRNAKRFRGGLVCKAHRWLYHSTLGSRVMKKQKKETRNAGLVRRGVILDEWYRAARVAVLIALLRLREVTAPSIPEMCSGSEASSYLRLIDFCSTQL